MKNQVVLPLAGTCGKADVRSKIVGGNPAQPNSIPWQVALVYTGTKEVFCGGTIVSPIHILTRAGCVQNTSFFFSDGFRVLVGEHDLIDNMDNAVTHNVATITNHPTYNQSAQFDNDFSILTLTEPIVLCGAGSHARAVCLPNPSDPEFIPGDTTFTVSGWGSLSFMGSFPNELHKVEVPFVTLAMCKEKNKPFEVTENMLCAGNIAEGGVDSCQGDSGGKYPLMATVQLHYLWHF